MILPVFVKDLNHFNSTKVQLKLVAALTALLTSLFQFH